MKGKKSPQMLTDITIRNAKPKDKPYKLSDAKGMYLLIKPNGGKYWRLKYRFTNNPPDYCAAWCTTQK